eukprot:scaffold198063_cov33-Prasinocladus_malaysianus.AAC.1
MARCVAALRFSEDGRPALAGASASAVLHIPADPLGLRAGESPPEAGPRPALRRLIFFSLSRPDPLALVLGRGDARFSIEAKYESPSWPLFKPQLFLSGGATRTYERATPVKLVLGHRHSRTKARGRQSHSSPYWVPSQSLRAFEGGELNPPAVGGLLADLPEDWLLQSRCSIPASYLLYPAMGWPEKSLLICHTYSGEPGATFMCS